MEQQKKVEVFKALADATRLEILKRLTMHNEPAASCTLVESCGSLAKLSQPTVSHHLAKLVDADVLTEEKRGTQKLYKVNGDFLSSIGIDIKKL